MINDIQKAWRDNPCNENGAVYNLGIKPPSADFLLGQAEERKRCANIARGLRGGPIFWKDGRPNARAIIGGDLIAQAIEQGQDEGEAQCP